jgi:hypothetical protein
MTAEPRAKAEHDDPAEAPTKADWLRRAEEALARQLEHREKYVAARARLLKLARSK